MSKFVHGLLQVSIALLNAVAMYGNFIPGKYHPLAVALQGVAHAALALINHKD